MHLFIVVMLFVGIGLFLMGKVLTDEPKTIEFGKPLTAASMESYLIFLQHAIRNGDDETAWTLDSGSSTHPIGVILDQLLLTWPKLVSDSGTYTSAGATAILAEQVFMNLGRLIRSDLDDDAMLYRISNMHVELGKSHAGVACTNTDMDALIISMYDLWFLVGGKLSGMFGEWGTTKYLAQDDAFAGWIACLQWVVIWFNLHDINYMKQERGLAEYVTDGGVVKGHFKPLVPTDPSTYGAILVAEENLGFLGATTPIDLLGMDAAYVDEPLTKGFNVVLHQASGGLAQRLLSQSEWSWRFNRFITVDPGFQMYLVENQEEQGEEGIGLVEATIKNRPMKNYTNITHLTYRRQISALVADFQSYYFKNKAFASAKKMFTTVNIYDLPIPGQGSGGLLAFQLMSLEEQITNADKVYTSFKSEVGDTGPVALMMRRSTDSKKVFQIIGDVSLDDYRVRMALAHEHLYLDGAKVGLKDVDADCHDLFSPYAGIIASFTQNEDEPKKISRTLYDMVDGATKGDMDGLTNSPQKWVDADAHVYGTTDFNYPVTLQHGKTVFYEGRDKDPFKKLAHTVYDINELDFTKIAASMRQAFGYEGASSEEIPVSAVPDDKPWEKDKKDDLEVSAIPEFEEKKDDLAVSAVVDEQKKVTKIEKDLKTAKDKVDKEKKKEADDKKKKK